MNIPLLREFRLGDEHALHAVFHSAIREVACRDYTSEQIAAWAPAEWDEAAWARRIRGISPSVVEVDGVPVAYADLQANGYIDHFFVAAAWARRGIGAMLMEHVHRRASEMGVERLWSDVSRTAQPFFARFGFHIVRVNSGVIRGVEVPNARMEKLLIGRRTLPPEAGAA